MNNPGAFLDEDDQTRRSRDAICANAIARALNERYGFVPLHVRYGLADEAILAARAEVEPVQRMIREFDQLTDDERTAAVVAAIRKAGPGWLDPDPPEPDYQAGERP